jgi:hypothetical protein
MANNYTQFSECITSLTEKEIEWWEKELQCPDEMEDVERKKRMEELKDLDVSNPDCWPDFAWKIDKDNSYLSIYTDEWGSVENVAITVQRFLYRFRPNGHFSLSWADWCSKPRFGEFGGGAIFVTHNDVQWKTTSYWITKKEQERK